jgi:hypothetical protein
MVIGPIRSVRPMDGAIAGPTKGLLVFSGGKSQFIKRARNAKLQVLAEDLGNSGFQRIATRAAPHNVYANPQDFLKQANKSHQDSPPGEFVFAPEAAGASAAVSGRPVTDIALTMSGGSHPAWAWDAAKGVFARSEGANPAVTADGRRLTAVNVVTVVVKVVTAQGVDPAGNSIPESVMVGEGKGFVATGGQIIAVRWSKQSEAKPMVLTAKDGSPVLLAPGNTWVEIMPDSGHWTTEPAASSSTSATPGASVTAGADG